MDSGTSHGSFGGVSIVGVVSIGLFLALVPSFVQGIHSNPNNESSQTLNSDLLSLQALWSHGEAAREAIIKNTNTSPLMFIASIFTSILVIYLLRRLQQILFVPLDVRKSIEGDLAPLGKHVRSSRLGGDGSNDSTVHDDTAEFLVLPSNARRSRGNLPPAFPNAWFRILFSNELKRNEVKYVSCLGQDFAVFRKSDGKVTVLDAYCPHLGANLAAGSKVVNDCLECPFHGWQFNSDGK